MASVIGSLRALSPVRPLTFEETLRVAERQATRLLELTGVTEPPVPEGVVSRLPRVQIERLSPIPVSGSTHWAQGKWLIVLNAAEPGVRSRFSLMHEFKHVIDHPYVSIIYQPIPGMNPHERAEHVCEYFAACVLMPKVWVRRAWATERVQDVQVLARRFTVSQTAMRIRLMHLGLMETPVRCRGPEWSKASHRRYLRAPVRPRNEGRKEEAP